MKIADVDLKVSQNVLKLWVLAIAPTSGWTDANLSEVVYVMPPVGGLQEIILSATAPAGPASTVIENFELSLDLAIADWFQGVLIRDVSGNELWSLRNPTLKKQPIGGNLFSVILAECKGDKLYITVQYGGGLRIHSFQLNWDGEIQLSSPPQVMLDLSHNGNGDTGRRLFTEILQFDLSTLDGFPNEKVNINLISPGNATEVIYIPPPDTSNQSAFTTDLSDDQTANPASVLRATERGYSDSFDLGEAMRNAMEKLPLRGQDTADFLATYRIVSIGAEVGGIAGLNRLYVDLEG